MPEPKTVKNRIHVDVLTADLESLVSAGATVVRPRDDEIRWTVLTDPEATSLRLRVRASKAARPRCVIQFLGGRGRAEA